MFLSKPKNFLIEGKKRKENISINIAQTDYFKKQSNIYQAKYKSPRRTLIRLDFLDMLLSIKYAMF